MVSYFLGNNTFPIVNQAVAEVQTTTIDSCLSGVGTGYGSNGRSIYLQGSASLSLPGCTVTSASGGGQTQSTAVASPPSRFIQQGKLAAADVVPAGTP